MTDNNLILKTLMELKEDIGGVKSDVKTVKDEVIILNKIVTKIDSKHNQDYLQYVASREEMDKRITPLEEDYIQRKECKAENRKGWKDTLFKSIQWIIMTLLTILFGYHSLKSK